MQTIAEFITNLEQLSDPLEQRHYIESGIEWLTDETVQLMKARANELLSLDIDRGVALADNIIYASQVSGKPIHRALGLMVQANALRRRGKLAEAVSLYDQAQQTALEAGNEVEAARSQVGKIGALCSLGEYKQALETAQFAGPILLAHNEIVSASTVFINAGICYAHLVQTQKSLEEYEKARRILEEAATPATQAPLRRILFNSALSLRDLGRYAEALDRIEQACEMAEQAALVIDKAIYQQGAATCHYAKGDYNKALRILHGVRDVFEKNRDVRMLVNCERFICECYLQLGRHEEALEQAERSINLLEEAGLVTNFEYIQAHYFMGTALFWLNESEQAIEVLLKAREIANQLDSGHFITQTNIVMAQIYLKQNDLEKAEELLKTILLDPEQTRLGPKAQLLLARLESQKANAETAQSLIEQALIQLQTQGVLNDRYEGYYQLAEIAEQQDDLPKALQHIEQSIQSLESLRGRIASETRSVFLRSKETVYEAGVALSLNTSQVEPAFNLAERVKSRSLVELVGSGLDIRVRVREEGDRPLVEEFERLRNRHNELTNRLAYWGVADSTLGQYELEEANRKILLAELQTCEKRLAQITERLQVENARYAEDVTLMPAYNPFDRQLLGADEVLVEYFVARDELMAFVVTRQEVRVVRQLMTVAQLNRQLALFRLNLAGTVKNLSEVATTTPEAFATRLNGLVNNSRALLQKLYDTLFAPLAPLVAGYCHLMLVPHGSLHYLPFHALYNRVTGHYLLEDFEEVTYLPAASLLHFCRERAVRATGKDFLVLGFSNQGALPCTVEEAQEVANTLGCEAYLEEAAALRNFREHAASKKIIHLATHGRYREDAPLFSSLLLADGELTGHELFNMELQASLVTLSACDSGLGAIGGGDEMMGLSRACLYAGASSLALSLWRVNDAASSLLMKEFYSKLLNGYGKAAALRQAQLTLLHNVQYQHPFYWAPFILIGDNGLL